MSHSQDERLDAYAKAPEEVRELYGSPLLGDSLVTASAMFPNQQGEFVDFVGDIILGLEAPQSALAVLSTQFHLSPETASKVLTGIESRLNIPIFHGTMSQTTQLPITPVPAAPVEPAVITPITSLPSTPAPTSTVMPTPSAVPPPSPAPTTTSLPTSRVMPRNETELPGALLQNLKASLAHDSVGVAYVDEQTPKPSYGAILDNGTKK